MSDTPKINTVVRSVKPHSRGYSQIDNAAMQDGRLSLRARGILALVLSLPDDWQHSAESISAGEGAEGRDAVRTALSELSRFGYARLLKRRDHRGHVVQYWTFAESPAPESQALAASPEPVFQGPDTSKPETDSQAPVSAGDGFSGSGPGPDFPATGKPGTGYPAPESQAHTKGILPNNQSPPAKTPETDSQAPAAKADMSSDLFGDIPAPIAKAAQTDGRHHAITSRWGALFGGAFGVAYQFSGRDASALKKLLLTSRESADEIISTATQAWARAKASPYARRCKDAATIHGLCTYLNDIRVELQTPASNAHRATNSRSFSQSQSYAGITDKG